MSDEANVIPSMPCPHCGYVVTRSTLGIGDGESPPNEGDISLCIECGDLSEFTAENGTVTGLRKLNAYQILRVLMAHPQVGNVSKEIKAGRSSRKT